MSNHRVCKFFNKPGGCLRGSTCLFSHDGREGALPRSSHRSGISSSSSGKEKSNAPASTNRNNSNTPPRRNLSSFNSHDTIGRFEHRQKPQTGVAHDRAPEGSTIGSPSAIPGTSLSEEALISKIVQSTESTDALFPVRNPRQFRSVGDQLRKFLNEDGFRIQRSSNATEFVELLGHSSSVYGVWGHEDRQLLLDNLTSNIFVGNGYRHLNTILSGSTPEPPSFEHHILPLLGFFTSHAIVQSVRAQSVNALYALINENFEFMFERIDQWMIPHLKRMKLGAMGGLTHLQSCRVLITVAIATIQFISRYKRALIDHANVLKLVDKLLDWFQSWKPLAEASRHSVQATLDKACTSPKVVEHAHKTLKRLVSLCQRENIHHVFPGEFTASAHASQPVVNVSVLYLTYEGPGIHRSAGPRHDNDFADIKDIRISPTHDELTSTFSPYLPPNVPNAPHHYPDHSMARLLDIQFRLLREELIAPLRDAVQLLEGDFNSPKFLDTPLGTLVQNLGGFYKGYINRESIIFPVYTDIGLAASIIFNTPPGRARAEDAATRASYWEHSSKRRLMPGALVALLWKTSSDFQIYLGTVCTSTGDLAKSARSSRYRLSLGVSFFEPSIYTRILADLKHSMRPSSDIRVLIESSNEVRTPPLYSTLNGFQYELVSLLHGDVGIQSLKLDTTSQDSITRTREILKSPHPLDATRLRSFLDPSQSDAMIDMLTSELGLMQGYTGVRLTNLLLDNGVKPVLLIAFTNHALDHLLKSILEARPSTKAIRLGSRSNDSMIAELSLDAIERASDRSKLSPSLGRVYAELKGIEKTMEEVMKKAMRRDPSSDDVLEFLESGDDTCHFSHSLTHPPSGIDRLYHERSEEEGSWTRVGKKAPEVLTRYDFWKQGADLDFVDGEFAAIKAAMHGGADYVEQDISPQFSDLQIDDDEIEDAESETTSVASEIGPEYLWMSQRPNVRHIPLATPSSSRQLPPQTDGGNDRLPVSSPPDHYTRLASLFVEFEFASLLDPAAQPDRNLNDLCNVSDVWHTTRTEREKLAQHWEQRASERNYQIVKGEFEDLRGRHEAAQRRWSELKEESRISILERADLIACTTNGAAKLTRMLKAVSPRVLVVEEAGQVLEAHVLSSLVPSVQHLILIGDPLQLRPTISNYSLSMDHPGSGSKLYRLDLSLMERLSSLGYPMSQLNVQRRMRPEIADLVRTTLYPNLEDHSRVSSYSQMRGLAKNVFFLDHRFGESGEDENSSSKTNKYEAAMIKDLVLYLLKQGPYSGEGDIVVLCAYLGQLAEVRKLLSSEVTTVLDERDLALLEEANPDAEGSDPSLSTSAHQVQHIPVSKRVLLRTVDNFQGEEAEIVILSLVRNTGEAVFGGRVASRGARSNHGTIGYLKSKNRTNVALSRAKQGLYILGDASLLATRSPMWKSIIDLLSERDSLGSALPICCQVHPEDGPKHVNHPGQIQRVAPDGGCLRPCDGRMPCGHLCKFKCHSEDPKHIGIKCHEPCTKLCPKSHPCSKKCFQPCGDCEFPVYNVLLPCGDVKPQTTCVLASRPEDIRCDVKKEKALPDCEHRAELPCSLDPTSYACQSPCGTVLACCGKTCSAQCCECTMLNKANDKRIRTHHKEHACGKDLRCGHSCTGTCAVGHECSGQCKSPCRQTCEHNACRKTCSEACKPCLEPCTWRCPHKSCNVPCGSICTRLPCDIRCEQTLACGHPCPSVCGENCDLQICPACATTDQKNTVVDFIVNGTLGEIDFSLEDCENRIITLECGHFFTVESLDGICHLHDFYGVDQNGKWVVPKNPAAKIIDHPRCPLCRRDITSPRYGRVVKRAKLDLLEHNLASRLSRTMSTINSDIRTFDQETAIRTIEGEASRSKLVTSDREPLSPQKELKAFEKLMSRDSVKLVPINGLSTLAGISQFPQTWKDCTVKLLKSYNKAGEVVATRCAHLQAYEAAFAQVYNDALREGVGSREARHPEQLAMMLARTRIGQPKPSANKRYQVEALWASIRIRSQLAELAMPQKEELEAEHCDRWLKFTLFLLKSSFSDAELALDICHESSSHRKMVRSVIVVERARFELLQFNWKATILKNVLDKETRDKFGSQADEMMSLFGQAVSNCRTQYSQSRPDDGVWLDTELDGPSRSLRKQWQHIRRAIFSGTFYQPVSLEDRQAILRAFEEDVSFAYRGHFYQCDNGHPYVIGECGGAMQTSACPECGVRIGGQSHNLTAGNRPDTEMEGLAAAMGAQASPWQRGRGAY
ncbi:uncharacterized protein EI90DRAFT_3056359 [Cantharellus anzutake]|uniref:uncharacterized protein n=1 Tax=Cantharellus anzutake TaxID=1750568 RepID=UPI0019041626|nr:uncharacterized protein EI90DRAFT_3056359 [Cantharellus anzutake]KAF8332045.1 hypothetical protein EI90DRAFT_3056359 [Cantharellus anzutake]